MRPMLLLSFLLALLTSFVPAGPALAAPSGLPVGFLEATQTLENGTNVHSVVMKDAGHWLMEERPQEVQTAILEFFHN